MSARGTVALCLVWGLGASTLSCQVVIDLGDYEFDQDQGETPLLPNPPDAGRQAGGGSAGAGGSGPPDPPVAGGAGGDAGGVPTDGGPDACVEPCVACDGCSSDEGCVAVGFPLPSNPCLVCEETSSGARLGPNTGARCGAEGNDCSEPDRCNADGVCVPKDRPEGIPCDDAPNVLGAACDAPDTCDGAGACVDRRANDGVTCDDGLFCTTGDQCLAGQCGGAALSCGDNRVCAEAAGGCQCAGCDVNGVCYAAGAREGACLVCDPQRSSTSLSSDVNAVCGASDGQCFGERTCDSNGQCVSRPHAAGTPCDDQVPDDPQCSGPDSCDGGGTCNPNHVGDFTGCNDNQLCTEGDVCLGGSCIGSPVFCGSSDFVCVENLGCVCINGPFCQNIPF